MILSKDLTKKKTVCLSKALLGSVSPSLTEYEVYSKYFSFFTLTDADTNLSCIKSRPHMFWKLINSMYKARRPSQDPTFFSFRAFPDLSRLSKLIELEIVIYSCASKRNLENLNLFHDFRRMSYSSKPEVYFLVTRSQQLFKVDTCLDHLVSYPYMFDKEASLQGEVSWGPALSAVTDLPEPPFDLGTDLPDLVGLKERLFEFWKEPVILVLLGKSNNPSNTNGCKLKSPKSHHFVTLCLVGPPLNKMSDLSLLAINKVVCFFANTKVGLLKENFKSSVIANLLQTVNKDRPSGSDLLNLPKLSKAQVSQAQKEMEAKKKRYVTRAELKGRKCLCEICVSEAFNDNMAKAGPERLVTYQMDVSELLGLLGEASAQNLALVQKLCYLSVAAMDIESRTVPLDLQRPVDSETGLLYATIDEASLAGHHQKVQKPLMIAHLDGTMVNGDPVVFVVESDEEESVYKMMRDYWSFVEEQHRLCRSLKSDLAQPLRSLVQSYKLKHVQFMVGHLPEGEVSDPGAAGVQGKHINGAWLQSIPGQLERALSRLISNYAVFSFYG